MKIREEIEKFSDPEERADLLMVFGFYHMQSEWNILSTCEFIGTLPKVKRKWHLSPIGRAVASQHRNAERVRILREALATVTTGLQQANEGYSEDNFGDEIRAGLAALEATQGES